MVDKTLILRLREEGKTYKEISDEVGCSIQYCNFVCNPEVARKAKVSSIKYQASAKRQAAVDRWNASTKAKKARNRWLGKQIKKKREENRG